MDVPGPGFSDVVQIKGTSQNCKLHRCPWLSRTSADTLFDFFDFFWGVRAAVGQQAVLWLQCACIHQRMFVKGLSRGAMTAVYWSCRSSISRSRVVIEGRFMFSDKNSSKAKMQDPRFPNFFFLNHFLSVVSYYLILFRMITQRSHIYVECAPTLRAPLSREEGLSHVFQSINGSGSFLGLLYPGQM